MSTKDLRRIIVQGQRQIFRLSREEIEELRRIYRLAWNDVKARLEYLERYEGQRGMLIAQTRRQLEALEDTWRELGRQTSPIYLRSTDRALEIGSATAEGVALRLGITTSLVPHDAALILHRSVLSLAGDVNTELAQRVRNEVTRGILSGESVQKVRRRVVGLGIDTEGTPFRRATQRAEAIVRTETIRAFNQATIERWRDEEEIIGYQHDAFFDQRTCEICAALHGKFYPKGQENPPPIHPNCRCTLLPVTKTFGKYEL